MAQILFAPANYILAPALILFEVELFFFLMAQILFTPADYIPALATFLFAVADYILVVEIILFAMAKILFAAADYIPAAPQTKKKNSSKLPGRYKNKNAPTC